jgi:hypothetical protein
VELFGQKKKLMGHVRGTYLINFDELLADRFVAVKILRFQPVLTDILNAFNVENQSIQSVTLRFLLFTSALLDRRDDLRCWFRPALSLGSSRKLLPDFRLRSTLGRLSLLVDLSELIA